VDHRKTDEADLVRRVQARDEIAFREVVERYQAKVFSIIFGILRNRNDAEDIAQQVFAKIYFSIGNFDFRSSLLTWIYKIAVNECYDYLRKKRVRKLVYESDFSDRQPACAARLRHEIIVQGLRRRPDADSFEGSGRPLGGGTRRDDRNEREYDQSETVPRQTEAAESRPASDAWQRAGGGLTAEAAFPVSGHQIREHGRDSIEGKKICTSRSKKASNVICLVKRIGRRCVHSMRTWKTARSAVPKSGN
jgi:RNA polymerase sigma factor (sigma-70 family)